MYKIEEIRYMLEKGDISPALLRLLFRDERKGVKDLLQKYYGEIKAMQEERYRLLKMYSLEMKEGIPLGLTAGVDEAGRGPLAGPVYAAAVVLPVGLVLAGLKDSKKLSSEQRGKIRMDIEKEALAIGWGYATVEEIDRMNILEATGLAMQRAYRSLPVPVGLVLVDGNYAPRLQDTRIRKVPDGDNCCASIAAASILAKERRDKIMEYLDTVFPRYGFAKHKGYGTRDHYAALEKYGPSVAHRASFLGKVKPGN